MHSNSSSGGSPRRSMSRSRGFSLNGNESSVSDSALYEKDSMLSVKADKYMAQRQPATPSPVRNRGLPASQSEPRKIDQHLRSPHSSLNSQTEDAATINKLSSELSRQADTMKCLEEAEENRILGHVRMLENFVSISTTAILTTSSLLVMGVAAKRVSVSLFWSMYNSVFSTQSSCPALSPWNNSGLLVASMFAGLGWWLKRRFETACV